MHVDEFQILGDLCTQFGSTTIFRFNLEFQGKYQVATQKPLDLICNYLLEENRKIDRNFMEIVYSDGFFDQITWHMCFCVVFILVSHLPRRCFRVRRNVIQSMCSWFVIEVVVLWVISNCIDDLMACICCVVVFIFIRKCFPDSYRFFYLINCDKFWNQFILSDFLTTWLMTQIKEGGWLECRGLLFIRVFQ